MGEQFSDTGIRVTDDGVTNYWHFSSTEADLHYKFTGGKKCCILN